MNFLQRLLLPLVATVAYGSVQAETVDLADAIFTAVEPVESTEPVVFTETVGSVTLTFSATENLLATDVRFATISSPNVGLWLGGANESLTEFTLETSTRITLDSYSTVSSGIIFLPSTFGVSGGSVLSAGNDLSVADEPVNLFVGGPLLLDTGTVYTFLIENPGEASQAFIGGLDFTTVIPLPAPILLLGSGLIGILALRRGSRA